MNRGLQTSPPSQANERINPKPQWLITLQDRAMLVFSISVVVYLVAFIYLLYGAFSGQLLTAHNLPLKDQARVMVNIALASKVLWWSLLIWVVALCIRNYQDESLGYLILLLTAGLYYGMPMLLSYLVESRGLRANGAVILLAGQFRNMAIPTFGIAILFIAMDLVQRIQLSFERAKYKPADPILKNPNAGTEPKHASILGKCWDLPYCEKYIREKCPRFLEKTACWRKKAGCMCDDSIVLKAMMSDATNQATAQKMASLFVSKSGNGPAQRGKARCVKCQIFLEHQKQKYRLLSPLVFPIAIVLFYEYLPYLRGAYFNSLTWMDRFVANLSFQASHNIAGGTQVIADISQSGFAMWTVLACVLIMFIAVGVQLMDYLILKLKL
ncbi:MAG: hypothetical protein IT210_09910 [Armatimonadetes bacterium]|nr:hypothetical protein [Armatimonadota bacterium]